MTRYERYKEKAKIYIRTRRKERRASARRRAGIDPDAAEALLSSATGCAICGESGSLVPDHCHATGRLRGALCPRCNRAIGAMKDSPDLLRIAATYLEGR